MSSPVLPVPPLGTNSGLFSLPFTAMHIKPRLLLASLGLAFVPFAASAQDIELVTEAPVTFEVVFGTSLTTTNGQVGVARKDVTRAYNSTITTTQILEGLKSDGFITDDSVVGWKLVAVRPAPADLYEVDTEFALYAVKVENNAITQRVYIPSSSFSINANYSVENNVATHSTRNIITSRGTVTNHADLRFKPSFVRKEVPPVITGPFSDEVGTYNLSSKSEGHFSIENLFSTGFSSISYVTYSDPVFFFGLSGIRYSAKGDFNGDLVNRRVDTKKYITPRGRDDAPQPEVVESEVETAGLVSIRVNVGAAKLVERSLYPEVSF